jgi:hypothetical protein
MKTITSREFSDTLNIDPQKVRRWSRDLFGIDQTAGQASGRARTYTIDKALFLYLGSILIADRGLSIPDTKEVLEQIKPWMKKEGYFPIRRNYMIGKTFQFQKETLSFYGWSILITIGGKKEIYISSEGNFSVQGDTNVIGKFQGCDVSSKVVVEGRISKGLPPATIKNTTHFALDTHIREFCMFFGI